MKKAIPSLCSLFGVAMLASGMARADGFDGTWDVTQVCYKAADGSLGYTFKYTVEVQGGVLDGIYNVPNNNGSIRLHGPIRPDGTVTLDADVVTGPSQFAMGHVKQGSPVHYHVAAKFAGALGTGNRVEPLRKCDFKFTKNET
jgi:hypothetical protein